LENSIIEKKPEFLEMLTLQELGECRRCLTVSA